MLTEALREEIGPTGFVDPEMTYDIWGHLLGIDRQQFRTVRQAAANKYDPRLQYHNFLHEGETFWAGMILADETELHGTVVDRKLLAAAILFHDAGYIEDYKAHGCDSREEYAGQLFAEFATDFRDDDGELIYNQEEIKIVRQIIMVTKVGVKPKTLTEKIMVRADLSSVEGSYIEAFLAKNKLLMEEDKMLKGADFNLVAFALNNLRALVDYYSHDLTLPHEDSSWMDAVTRNLARFMYETATVADLDQLERIQNFLKDIGGTTLAIVLRKSAENNGTVINGKDPESNPDKIVI